MTHKLKTWPQYFYAVWDGRKTFEYRDAFDRDFQVGDTLILQEYDPNTGAYSGRSIDCDVTYILRDEIPGTFVVMAIKPMARR